MDNIILATTLSTSFIGAIFLLNRYWQRDTTNATELSKGLIELSRDTSNSVGTHACGNRARGAAMRRHRPRLRCCTDLQAGWAVSVTVVLS